MLMIEFDHVLPQLLNLLVEMTDLRLVLFSCFNEGEIISQETSYGPEEGLVKLSYIINRLSQLSVIKHFIFRVKIVHMLIDNLYLFLSDEVYAVFKVECPFMDVGQVYLQL